MNNVGLALVDVIVCPANAVTQTLDLLTDLFNQLTVVHSLIHKHTHAHIDISIG